MKQFHQLKKLIGENLKIWLPKQVEDEVFRNRETKLKESLGYLKTKSHNIPNVIKGFDEYDEFSKQVNLLKESQKELLNKVEKSIADKTLLSDKVILDTFDLCEKIDSSEEIINSAIVRYNTGNPPGKDKKYGDAINWISLLNNLPNNEELYFISYDKDYESCLVKNTFNPFLVEEWTKEKNSKIIYYKSLTEFFKVHLTAIELANELTAELERKNDLIYDLENSYSFAQTHNVVSQLSAYSSWTEDEKSRINLAADRNSQIDMIRNDYDIQQFLIAVNKYNN